MIKAIIFDLGGVYFTNGTKIAIKKISKKYSLKEEEIEGMLKPGSEFGKLFRTGKLTSEQFFDKLRNEFNIKASDKELVEIWFGSYKPIKEVVAIVEELKKKGLKIYFLSDNVKERAEYLQDRYNFLEHFIDGTFSHKVGLTKFDGVKIFEHSLKKTGNKPDEVIFIDDNEMHVKTAESLGMNAIHFRNPKQLETELKKLNLF